MRVLLDLTGQQCGYHMCQHLHQFLHGRQGQSVRRRGMDQKWDTYGMWFAKEVVIE